MTINLKLVLITLAAAIVIIIVLVFWPASVRNHAVALEEQVYGAKASVETQEKRRVDLVYNLVDTVKAYSTYEHDALLDIIAARTKDGEIDSEGGATVNIRAVVEDYPDLKASDEYLQLMTELSTTENRIAQHRENYNEQVKAYRKYTRQWPQTWLLRNVVDFEYLEFNAPSDAPQNLWK